MRSWSYGRSLPAHALLACALGCGCQYAPDDIALRDAAVAAFRGAGASRSPNPSGQRDSAVEARPVRTDMDSHPSVPIYPIGMDSSPSVIGPTGMDSGLREDSGMDGAVMDAPSLPVDGAPDVASDATSETIPDAPPEAAPDAPPDVDLDDGGEPDAPSTNPCEAGLWTCAPVQVETWGDWVQYAVATVDLTVNVDGHAFHALTRDGRAEIELPIGRDLWLRAEAPGYSPTDTPLRADDPLAAWVFLFTPGYSTNVLAALGLPHDESLGLAVAVVRPPIAGAGLQLNQPHPGPFTLGPIGFVISNVLVTGGNHILVFPNVPAGEVVPTWISPPGHACAGPFDSGYASRAGVVLNIPLFCAPLDIDLDAGAL
jgi:hypothetical protein